MKTKFISALLAVILIVSMVGCSKSEDKKVTDVNLKHVAKEELGMSMPKIIFAEDGKIAFWGTFGLYIINGEDGSIYRSINLESLNLNYMTGDLVTRFLASSDYKSIFFYNEAPNGDNLEDFYYYYNIEEDVVRQIPVGTAVEVAKNQPVFPLDYAGGKPTSGYSTDAYFYDQDMLVYLHAADWYVKDLELVFFNTETEELTHIPIFTKENIK